MSKRALSLLACFTILPALPVFGQGTTPSVEPPGSITNGDAPAGQVKSWVSRLEDKSAIAVTVTVVDTPSGASIIGTMRKYKSDGEGGLMKDSFTVDPDDTTGPTTPTTIDVIPVRLVARTDAFLRYPSWDILYDDRDPVFTKITLPSGNPPLVLGWVAFKAGRGERSQSTVMVRTDRRRFVGATTNPCDAPPADDVGEEELLSASTKYPNAPGTSLPPLAATPVDPAP